MATNSFHCISWSRPIYIIYILIPLMLWIYTWSIISYSIHTIMTYPPSTISSRIKNAASNFSNKVLFSTCRLHRLHILKAHCIIINISLYAYTYSITTTMNQVFQIYVNHWCKTMNMVTNWHWRCTQIELWHLTVTGKLLKSQNIAYTNRIQKQIKLLANTNTYC